MPAAIAEFERVVRGLAPTTAVVLGSGLADIATQFRESASIWFRDVPGLIPTTVQGHQGRLAVGLWNEVPALLFLGRLHFYEGHSREVVTGTVRIAADFGARRLILTNAAGGIDPTLEPGAIMAIRGHIKLVGPNAWRELALSREHGQPSRTNIYSPRLLAALRDHEAAASRELPVGIYAALTGPCYETPAEIRALGTCGASAVGMSTALEAEAAAERGLEVAAISCITNKGAGLGDATLDHSEVLMNAKMAVERLGEMVATVIRTK